MGVDRMVDRLSQQLVLGSAQQPVQMYGGYSPGGSISRSDLQLLRHATSAPDTAVGLLFQQQQQKQKQHKSQRTSHSRPHGTAAVLSHQESNQSRSASPKQHALVVDDDPVNCRVLSRMLERAGWTTDTITDSERAVDRLQAGWDGAGGGGAYDVVFIDYNMPGMSGPEVVAAMRARRFSTPALCVTATAETPAFMKELQTAGFQGILEKPFDAASLQAALAKHTSVAR